MKLGPMLGDVLGSLFRRPATVRYPFTRSSSFARTGPVGPSELHWL
jgi:hypothetical protein